MELDLEFVAQVARRAGSKALEMQKEMRAELKADESYVTNVDRDVEQFVRAQLAERYPDFGFLGEEFGRWGDRDAPLWAVDPIDGTTNMVFGLPCWAVSIGLLVEGVPRLGALYLPQTEEMFTAVSGKGSYRNGARLHAQDRHELHAEDTLGFTSTALKLLDTSALPGRIRCLGSIAAEIAYTGAGFLASLVGWNEGPYDMAAALCVAQESGCIGRYLSGDPLDLGALLSTGKTDRPFVVAPPGAADLVSSLLLERNGSSPVRCDLP